MSTNDVDSLITEHNMPRHIAIIMDGNGRWAQKKTDAPRLWASGRR
jgi:undecaprenyl pyrophosphate synthase